MSKAVDVPLASIKEDFFVRHQIDDDRVLFFIELYQSGAQVPPLDLELGTDVLLDGRHRKRALEHLERKTASCKYIKIESRKDAILHAFAANTKRGPKPPTQADIDLVIRMLRKEGMPEEQIAVRISSTTPLPPRIIRNHIRSIKLSDQKTAVRRAVALVASGDAKVDEAAKQFGVKPDAVKTVLADVADAADTSTLLKSVKGEVASKCTSFGHSLGAISRSLNERLQFGEVDVATMSDIYDDIGKRLKRLLRSHEDRQKRLAANGSLHEAPAADAEKSEEKESPKKEAPPKATPKQKSVPTAKPALSGAERIKAMAKQLGLED